LLDHRVPDPATPNTVTDEGRHAAIQSRSGASAAYLADDCQNTVISLPPAAENANSEGATEDEHEE